MDFSAIVEGIVTAAEQRIMNASSSSQPAPLPLVQGDLDKLHSLCRHAESELLSKGAVLEDLGFADVDPDSTGQLVMYLQKHVVLAASVDLIQASYAVAKQIQRDESTISMEQWLQSGGKGRAMIDTLRMGLEAATILLFIVTSPAIDRRVVNEDAIEASIHLFRHNLNKHLLPALNQVGHIAAAAAAGAGDVDPAVQSSAKKRRRSSLSGGEAKVVKEMKKAYHRILSTVGGTVLIMERLQVLVEKIPLDDQQVLSMSSGAMGALEWDPTTEGNVQLTHQVHVAMVGLTTAIFRKYPRHRTIVVEDIFPLMLKMPTSKRSMRTYPVHCSSVLYPPTLARLSSDLSASVSSSVSTAQPQQAIQTMTMLILSLTQSAVVRPSYADADQEFMSNSNNVDNHHPMLLSGLRHCQATSDMFVTLLLQRCAKKSEDGGASEFRPILSNLIDDLLLLVLVPEYPVAEILLLSIARIISRNLMRYTSPKALQGAETTYLNTIFDAIGKICAAEARILRFHRENPVRLSTWKSSNTDETQKLDCYCKDNIQRGFMVTCGNCKTWFHGTCMGQSKATVSGEWLCDSCQLARIVEFEQDRNTNLGEYACPPELIDESYCMRRLLVDYLSIVARQTSTPAGRDAYEFHLSKWLLELQAQSVPKSQEGESADATPPPSPLLTSLLEMWAMESPSSLGMNGSSKSLSGMLHCLSEEGRCRMAVYLACNQSGLLLSYRGQIGLFVQLMGADSPAQLRKLAVKAIERVSGGDQQLMVFPFIKKAVTALFADEAISVREAAVSLVGAYVVKMPGFANAFHPAFMMGLNDTGISVRKKSVKILQDILTANPRYKGRAAACSEMLRHAADPKEDESVRDGIHDLFLKLWLENGDEKVEREVTPTPSPVGVTTVETPKSRVYNVEIVTPNGLLTPSPRQAPTVAGLTTPAPAKKTRSTDRVIRRKKMQIRSEVAAEQMVEVVKAADTGENLTVLFRELMSGVSDTDKDRKATERKKRQVLAQSHCTMLVDSLFELLLSVEDHRGESKTSVGKEIVAIMRTIKVFAEVSPAVFLRHLDTLLPYLKADNGLTPCEEAVVISSLCESLAFIATIMKRNDLENLCSTTLASDLTKVTYQFGREPLSSAIHCLCALAHHKDSKADNPFRVELFQLTKKFYDYLLAHEGTANLEEKTKKARANIQRALSVLGNVCRYLDGSIEESECADEDPLEWSNITSKCEDLFMQFMEKEDAPIKCAALRGICGVFISHPRELLRMNESGLIERVMATASPASVQLESLYCWRDILLTEETRVESGEAASKMKSKKNITLSKKISGDQDADATLFGGVLTSHASRLFQMTQVRDKKIRYAALDVIGHLLRQGQVNPNEAVPFLLALQGDVEESEIRSLALKLLMIEGEKRPDMLRQRVRAGVKQAYAFQQSAYPEKATVSALVRFQNSGSTTTQCVFTKVFKECIVRNKKQRLGLYRNLLGLFDFTNRKIGSVNGTMTASDAPSEMKLAELPLLIFTSQVLVYLPYTVGYDPLYIIYTATSILALQGADLLDRLADFLRPLGLASSDKMDETNAEEDDLERAAKHKKPRKAKEAADLSKNGVDVNAFLGLCAEAGVLVLLLRLKVFLREAFNLSEVRCLAYNPEAKERVNDKVTSRASQLDFDFDLPLARGKDGSLKQLDLAILQYAEFRRLMRVETYIETQLDDSDDEEEGDPLKRKREDSDEMVVD